MVYYKIPVEYQMNCKYCNSEKVVKNGSIKETQVYKCKECGKRFFANGKFAKMRNKKHLIVAALNFYYDGLSLRKAQRNLEQIFGEKVSGYNPKLDKKILTSHKRVRYGSSSAAFRHVA